MTISILISISIFFKSVDISTIDMSYRYIEQGYLRVISDFPWQLFTPRVLCFSLPPFLPAPEKLLLFVMMFCLPAASAHSLPPPPTHKPCPLNLLFFDHKAEKNLVPVSISSPVTPQATKENHFHFFYSILHFHLSIRAKVSQGPLFIWL